MTDAMTLVKDAASLQKAIHQEAPHIAVEGRIRPICEAQMPTRNCTSGRASLD